MIKSGVTDDELRELEEAGALQDVFFAYAGKALNAPCSAGTPWKKCLISKKANDLPL